MCDQYRAGFLGHTGKCFNPCYSNMHVELFLLRAIHKVRAQEREKGALNKSSHQLFWFVFLLKYVRWWIRGGVHTFGLFKRMYFVNGPRS